MASVIQYRHRVSLGLVTAPQHSHKGDPDAEARPVEPAGFFDPTAAAREKFLARYDRHGRRKRMSVEQRKRITISKARREAHAAARRAALERAEQMGAELLGDVLEALDWLLRHTSVRADRRHFMQIVHYAWGLRR